MWQIYHLDEEIVKFVFLTLKKLKFILDKGKFFTKNEVYRFNGDICAIDANSEKKWGGIYNSLSKRKLQGGEWDEYWKTQRKKMG